MTDTNPNIHSNPDAMAWAKEFGKHESSPPEDVMLGWFANAMMAMYDHIYQNNTVTSKATPAPALVEAVEQLMLSADVACQVLKRYGSDPAAVDAEIHLSTASNNMSAALSGEKGRG